MLWRLLRPILFLFDPERIHYVAMALLTLALAVPGVRALVRWWYRVDDPVLQQTLWDLPIAAPVGLGAGFDKDARWFNDLAALGFGHIEVGTLTGQAQPGNPLPRLFRLAPDRALINRFGFNNRGSADAAARLQGARIDTVLGINIGKSKVVENQEAIADYLVSLDRVLPYAAWVTVNVSSPNTPGLRDLQEAASLRGLLEAVVTRTRAWAAEGTGRRRPPVLVKLAPDLDDASLPAVVALCESLGVDGIVATNTTIRREGLVTPATTLEQIGAGGLSGAPLTARSRAFVHQLYALCGGRLPIVGVGGVMNDEDAWEMIRAGASLVQVYTGFIYGGPGFAAGLHRGLARRARAAGYASITEAIGAAHR